MPAWAIFIFAVAIAVNALAGFTTSLTVGLMRSVSPFANEVRELEVAFINRYNLIAFPCVIAIALLYLWPVLRFSRSGARPPASELVKRRTLSAPFVLALFSFIPWVASIVVFAVLTLVSFGRWSVELMSQQVLSPLVNGTLATAVTYFCADLIFRSRVVPRVFGDGELMQVRGAASLGLRTRLLFYLTAVAFLPLFTMLGLARGAGNRLVLGVEREQIVSLLNDASSKTFIVYVLLGILLTTLLARSLTRPLAGVTRALGRIQRGDLDVELHPTANDEVGVVEEGVNRMVAALRDRERILQTFGRVVEPAVRDHLLRGELELGGELRTASVLFCDLRGFTAFAERTPPAQVVETLNEFFTAMTTRVRACGGFVDKFIGDALLVVFGLFDEDGSAGPAGAAAAVDCAAAMRAELETLNRGRQQRGLPPLAVAASIHSGELLAGTIGARDRHEFTVVGDTVNVAARLQETCKQKGWDFLVSQDTLERAQRAGKTVAVAESEMVLVRGRERQVRVFRLA